MPVQIPAEWVNQSNLSENLVDDKLKALLKNLENYL